MFETITSVANFALDVNNCSTKYVDLEPIKETDEPTEAYWKRVDDRVEAYRQEIRKLFQTAKSQDLTIPKAYIMGDYGIHAYFILLPKNSYIEKLSKALKDLLTNDFSDLIVEDPRCDQERKPLVPVRPLISRKRKPKTRAPETNLPTEILSDELHTALHAFVFNKANRNTLNLNFDIEPHRKHYLEAWGICTKYFLHLWELPENIQQIKKETEERINKVKIYKLADFKNTEVNNYLYERIATVLSYLKEQFPIEKA